MTGRKVLGEGRSALIGYSGFVGGNLLRATAFDELYNSANIDDIRERAFGTVVCAGVSAVKWKANQDPAGDWAGIARLWDAMGTVRARSVILISTTDVYPTPVAVDEDTDLTGAHGAPYGQHRLELERLMAGHFETSIIRLPSLYGPGLKKNIVYDFMHANQIDRIHADAVFQFYGLTSLWQDIGIARRHGVTLLNVATEPVSVGDIARNVFGREFENRPHDVTPVRYDMRSRHAHLFGSQPPYLYDRSATLQGLRDFVHAEQSPRDESVAAGGTSRT